MFLPIRATVVWTAFTPRWLFVLAAATPPRFGDPVIVDETLEQFDLSAVRPGDVVGIGIHTANALRGYDIGNAARKAGAWVVFGGIHSTLFPDEVFQHGAAHAVVSGDGDQVWARALADCEVGSPQARYDGGRVGGESFSSAPVGSAAPDKYMWASVQTVRGCQSTARSARCGAPTADAAPAQTCSRGARGVELRRKGFRSCCWQGRQTSTRSRLKTWRWPIARRQEPLEWLTALAAGAVRDDGAAGQAAEDMVFFTQITMEAAEDPEFLAAMKRARIRGALVGVESVTPEGLKAIFKNFNDAGDALVTKLQKFREGGVHVLGSFIFGLPTDKMDTFMATADLAQKAGVTFAQFVMLTPLPGTLDFEKWEKEEVDGPKVDAIPLTALADPVDKRRDLLAHRACRREIAPDARRGTASTRGRTLSRRTR